MEISISIKFLCLLFLSIVQNAMGITTYQLEEKMKTLNQERQQRVNVMTQSGLCNYNVYGLH